MFVWRKKTYFEEQGRSQRATQYNMARSARKCRRPNVVAWTRHEMGEDTGGRVHKRCFADLMPGNLLTYDLERGRGGEGEGRGKREERERGAITWKHVTRYSVSPTAWGSTLWVYTHGSFAFATFDCRVSLINVMERVQYSALMSFSIHKNLFIFGCL